MIDWRARFQAATKAKMDYIGSPDPYTHSRHVGRLTRGYWEGIPIVFDQCIECFACYDLPYRESELVYTDTGSAWKNKGLRRMRPTVEDDNFMALPEIDWRTPVGISLGGKNFALHRKKIIENYNDAWWEIYRQYIASPEWAAKRAARFALSGGRCFGAMTGCSGKAEHCHHLGKRHDSGGDGAYEFAGDEPLFLLVSLCFNCHDKIHDGKLSKDTLA